MNKPTIPVIPASEYLGDRPTPSTWKDPTEYPRIDAREQSYQLLGILQSHAPTGTEQALLAANYNRMVGAGETWEQITRNLAVYLAEGIQEGNWPWIWMVRS